ncbi:hypothetical protein Tco_1062410, partial [Tanacetum coccineum]
QRYPGRIYVEGHVDIFDMIDIYLFSVIWAKQDGSSIRLYSFGDVARSGVESYRLSHDESFGVDDLDLDLNLNELVDLNVFQIKTQYDLHVSHEPYVGRTQEPIVENVRIQEPHTEEVRTYEPIMKNVLVKDYVSYREDVEQGNGKEDKSTPSDEIFFYDDERIGTSYESQYDVQYSEDAGTDDDDDLLVDEENEIVESDVDVHLFGISMDVPFDNIGVTNLVPNDVLKGEDVDVINADGFDSDLGNDDETTN